MKIIRAPTAASPTISAKINKEIPHFTVCRLDASSRPKGTTQTIPANMPLLLAKCGLEREGIPLGKPEIIQHDQQFSEYFSGFPRSTKKFT